MDRRSTASAWTFAALFFVLAGSSGAAAFECPEAQPSASPDVLKESEVDIQALDAALESGDAENKIAMIIADLRRRNPDLSDAEVINYLTAAYCPAVAKDEGLSDSEKTEKVDRFAGEVQAVVDRAERGGVQQ